MTQELYIDGKLMDVDEGTKVTMSIKGNLLRDVKDVVGNSTYTVNIPLTTRNRAVIDAADVIARGSWYPFTRHTARYIRDGVTIIPDGVAVVMGISSTIEIVITWGVNTTLTHVIGEGLKLTDLASTASTYYPQAVTDFTWGVFRASELNYPFFYAHSNWNKPLEDREKRAIAVTHGWTWKDERPCVRVPWILREITTEWGLSFSFPTERQDLLNRLCIPLVKDKPTDYTLANDTITGTSYSSQSRGWRYNLKNDSAGGVLDIATSPVSKITTSAAKTVTLYFDARADIPNKLAKQLIEYGATLSVVTVNANNDEDFDNVASLPVEIYIVGNTQTTIQVKGTLDVELAAAGYGLEIWSMSNENKANVFFTNLSVKVTPQADHVQLQGYYPIVNNLPDITVADFLRVLCALLGVFPKQNHGGNSLDFVTYEAVWAGKTNAVDWTRRIIPSYEQERPKTMSFTPQGWAQVNHYKWKETDGYTGQSDGVITLPVETLEKERTVIDFPFALAPSQVTRMGYQAAIGCYLLNNFDALNDGSATDPTFDIEDHEDVICLVTHYGQDVGTTTLLINSVGLKMQNLITEYYGHLVAALSTPNIITERIRIGDVELMNFDDTKPVYLQQYGRYFAVLEITAQADGTAEVQMLALSEGGAAEEPEPPTPPTPVLPYDAEVEWLQSDGSAYLDTGIKAAGNLYIKTYLVDFFVNANGSKWPFGGRTSSSSGMFGLLINNISKRVFMAYNTSSGTIGFNTCTSYPQSAVVEIGNGNVKIGTTSHTYTTATFTSTQNVTLFGLNNGGSQIVAAVKIGPTYLTDGTNTVDLIPVRVGQVGYMYDRVSGELFGNAGTGAFILGNDKNT